jgi:transcriptional regulator with XRE-family HTH domain
MTKPATDPITTIGKQLRRARKTRGLSLDAAAALANLSREQLREVEKGYPKNDGGRRLGPTLSKLERIANVYGLTVRLARQQSR